MAHQAVLSWQASPDAGKFGTADGYVVFSGPTKGGETTQLTASPITALTYTDTTLEPGDTYYVVKTSLGGVLSAPSDEVEAVILPSAPIDLVLVSAS
jgi:hypothetical protein